MPEEWTVKTLKEHFEALLKQKDEALRLQAAEYERRLENLNNEYARIERVHQTKVSYSVLATVISMLIAALALIAKHIQ